MKDKKRGMRYEERKKEKRCEEGDEGKAKRGQKRTRGEEGQKDRGGRVRREEGD